MYLSVFFYFLVKVQL